MLNQTLIEFLWSYSKKNDQNIHSYDYSVITIITIICLIINILFIIVFKIFKSNQINVIHKISGKFGEPLKKEREILVKKFKQFGPKPSKRQIMSFLEEGLLLKGLSHRNIMSLIGVSVDKNGLPVIVLPFMANGYLLSYIRDDKNHLNVKQLIAFAVDIANGMSYISGQHIVHKDLAARNCFIDADLCVKVCDSALSSDIYPNDYYSDSNDWPKLPVKWMATESLQTEPNQYTTESDVWSYGVLVWELMTRGVTPYPGVHNRGVLKHLRRGHRLFRPQFCPKSLYDILLKCWSESPNSRPSFAQMANDVKVIKETRTNCRSCQAQMNRYSMTIPVKNTKPYTE